MTVRGSNALVVVSTSCGAISAANAACRIDLLWHKVCAIYSFRIKSDSIQLNLRTAITQLFLICCRLCGNSVPSEFYDLTVASTRWLVMFAFGVK